jgi:hypothetical protein
VEGAYPVTPVGSALKDAAIESVVRVPVAVAVWAAEHAPEAIKEVARALVPEAMVIVQVAHPTVPVVVTVPPVRGAENTILVTVPDPPDVPRRCHVLVEVQP